MWHRRYRFYSPALDCEAIRLSTVDGRGSEYFAIVPARGGREERETRTRALEMIDMAIERGDPPGEVHDHGA